MIGRNWILHTHFFTFWRLPLIGGISVLLTVVFSKDPSLRKSAIYNLLCFLIGTSFLLFVKRQYFPSYDFSLALRNDWLPFTGLNILVHIFVLPIPILGIPLRQSPAWMLLCLKIIIFYQIFLHLPVKKDILLLRYIFVTPYFHNIHHSTKFDGTGQNFGGFFSFWDRFFGTYRQGQDYLESFGLSEVKQPDSLWELNIAPIKNLFWDCWQKRSVLPLFVFCDSRPLRIPSLQLSIICALLILDLAQIIYDKSYL